MIQNGFVLKMYFVFDRNEVVTIGGPKKCLKKGHVVVLKISKLKKIKRNMKFILTYSLFNQ